jgi:hypothetical protein
MELQLLYISHKDVSPIPIKSHPVRTLTLYLVQFYI